MIYSIELVILLIVYSLIPLDSYINFESDCNKIIFFRIVMNTGSDKEKSYAKVNLFNYVMPFRNALLLL